MWHVVTLKIQGRLLGSEQSKKSEMGNHKKSSSQNRIWVLDLLCSSFFFFYSTGPLHILQNPNFIDSSASSYPFHSITTLLSQHKSCTALIQSAKPSRKNVIQIVLKKMYGKQKALPLSYTEHSNNINIHQILFACCMLSSG